MATGPLAMVAEDVVSVRVFIDVVPLARSADVMLEATVDSAVGYFSLRSGGRCSGSIG